MKIKTITCHDVYNVGASLQAYALATYLKELGHDVEIIDYKPDYLSGHYRLTGVSNPRYDKPFLRLLYQVLKFPKRYIARHGKRKREYDDFTTKYLPLTDKRYVSNEDLKENLPYADVYIAGSDQIWNTLFRNGKDPSFYLDFVPEYCIKASYAASFATEDVLDEWKTTITRWLSKFDFISVRESSGVQIIEKLGIPKAIRVMDPVFLLEQSVWNELEQPLILHEKYLLVYDFDRSGLVEMFAKKMAGEHNWKIYSVLPCGYADRCFDKYGPRAFVYLIHNAEFVLSNSFHATAFSMIFHKQFVVFNRAEKINTRMQDLLGLVGLQNRNVGSIDSINKITQIDYTHVQQRIDLEIKNSKEYLQKVLRGGKHD